MSLLAACVEPNPQGYYFALSNDSGVTVLESPLNVENTSQTAAVSISIDANANTIISGAAAPPNTFNAASTYLGVPSSTQAAQLSYNALQGTDNFKVGRPSVSGPLLVGAISAGGSGQIQMNSNVGTETLLLGANPTSYRNITLAANGQSLFSQPPSLNAVYSVTPVLVNGTGVLLGGGGTYNIPNPAGAGLYCIMVSCSSLDTFSVASQISCIGYWNGTAWKVGGVTGVDNGAGPALGIIRMAPEPVARANLVLENTAGTNAINLSVITLPIFTGAITGMPA
jgi:hypothetical protein